MKAVLRYLIVLATCLIPITFVDGIKDRFLVELGVLFGVTAAYWIGYFIIEKKRKNQSDQDSK